MADFHLLYIPNSQQAAEVKHHKNLYLVFQRCEFPEVKDISGVMFLQEGSAVEKYTGCFVKLNTTKITLNSNLIQSVLLYSSIPIEVKFIHHFLSDTKFSQKSVFFIISLVQSKSSNLNSGPSLWSCIRNKTLPLLFVVFLMSL